MAKIRSIGYIIDKMDREAALPVVEEQNVWDWADALKSTNYRQNDGMTLFDGTSYSAFGVACEVFMKRFPELLFKQFVGGKWSYVTPTSGEYHYMTDYNLPGVVTKWLNLRSEEPVAIMEDEGKYFSEMAEVIAKLPKELFYPF